MANNPLRFLGGDYDPESAERKRRAEKQDRELAEVADLERAKEDGREEDFEVELERLKQEAKAAHVVLGFYAMYGLIDRAQKATGYRFPVPKAHKGVA